MGEGLAVLVGSRIVEGEEDRTDGIGRARIGDDHPADRLGFHRDLAPDAENIEQVAGGGDDGGGALLLLPGMLRRAIDHFHGQMRRRLLHRHRERQADITAAGDQNVERCGFGHGVLLDA